MTQIYQDLSQFSSYTAPIDLAFNQYLLKGKEPILFHTGNIHQAAALLSRLEEELGNAELKYIFVSHFEADECGGLELILEKYPNAKTICSPVTARQLTGFGLGGELLIQEPDTTLQGEDFELEFISYPAEMHLWEGLLVYERQRGIFFSADLMIRFGDTGGTSVEGSWLAEIDNIQHAQVPDPALREKLQQRLTQLKPQFVATGHGPCLTV